LDELFDQRYGQRFVEGELQRSLGHGVGLDCVFEGGEDGAAHGIVAAEFPAGGVAGEAARVVRAGSEIVARYFSTSATPLFEGLIAFAMSWSLERIRKSKAACSKANKERVNPIQRGWSTNFYMCQADYKWFTSIFGTHKARLSAY